MSYRKIFENSENGKCPACGSEAEERREHPRYKGWFCSNQNCQYSFDKFLEKMTKNNEKSLENLPEDVRLKKEIKFIIIGSIIGAIVFFILFSLLEDIDILTSLGAGLWVGIAFGGGISVARSFYIRGKAISNTFGIILAIIWFVLAVFAGFIWPLIRILIKVSKLKKLNKSKEE